MGSFALKVDSSFSKGHIAPLDIYLGGIFQRNLSCVLQSSEQTLEYFQCEPQQWVGLMVLCFLGVLYNFAT